MLRRLLSLLFLLWFFGFVWFGVALPKPRDGVRTGAVVVLTGGPGRIDRGLEALRRGWSQRMLVAGVDPEVRPREFEAQYAVSSSLMQCCVTLDFRSYDTRSNAAEVTHWLGENRFRSVRLVTTDWHMRRAVLELRLLLPEDVAVVQDAVRSQPSFRILFLEYHKLLARYILAWWES